MPLYLRDAPSQSLGELAEDLHTDIKDWGGTSDELEVVESGGTLTIRIKDTEVPATSDGVEQLASFAGIPRSYVLDIDPDMQAYNLNNRLHRHPDNVRVRYTDDGISEVLKPERLWLDPSSMVEVAMNVLGAEADVVDFYCDPDEFLLDVSVPEGFDRGIGGDPQVNDITRGGIRIGQNRKSYHAPWATTFLYRLMCTNGMEIPEIGHKIDARKNDVEGVLAELEKAAQHAFGMVESRLNHFYELRNQRIEGDVTQAVLRIARERGLPDRTALALADNVQGQLDPEVLGHEVSIFDVTNLITNQANNPELRSRRGPRRTLERAGGAIVQQEQERCRRCQQVIHN